MNAEERATPGHFECLGQSGPSRVWTRAPHVPRLFQQLAPLRALGELVAAISGPAGTLASDPMPLAARLARVARSTVEGGDLLPGGSR